MALKPGDIVTLTINPTVCIAPYTFLKPGASLTRALGDDTVSSLKEMEEDVRALSLQAAAAELDIATSLKNAVDAGTLEAYVAEEITNGTQGPIAQSAARQPVKAVAAQAGTGVPVRKTGPTKKA